MSLMNSQSGHCALDRLARGIPAALGLRPDSWKLGLSAVAWPCPLVITLGTFEGVIKSKTHMALIVLNLEDSAHYHPTSGPNIVLGPS